MIPRTRPLRARPALGVAMIAVVIVAAAVAAVALGSSGGREGRHDGDPPAPWRRAVARSTVPPAYVAAWERARNRATCALLFPLDGGPRLPGAKVSGERTPNDNGWDIFLTGSGGSIEVLGLFGPSAGPDTPPDSPVFTRSWADGSEARYGADVGNTAPGSFDPDSSAFEAVLVVPGQTCAYRIYDTLGRDHLEATFDRLRVMAR